jgi:hypothetical protein
MGVALYPAVWHGHDVFDGVERAAADAINAAALSAQMR